MVVVVVFVFCVVVVAVVVVAVAVAVAVVVAVAVAVAVVVVVVIVVVVRWPNERACGTVCLLCWTTKTLFRDTLYFKIEHCCTCLFFVRG